MREKLELVAREWRRPYTPEELQAHILASYKSLRFGVGGLAVLMPLVVWLVGLAHGVAWQDSISDYYFALAREVPAPGGPPLPAAAYDFPVRGWFVGGVVAIAFCLFLYRGVSALENGLLNLTSLFAVGVALIPMRHDVFNPGTGLSPHYVAAILMFLSMAAVSWFCARDTLDLLPPDERPRYDRLYRGFGIVMAVFPFLGWGLTAFLFGNTTHAVFVIEAFGIVIFGTYWLVKTREMLRSSADRRLMSGEPLSGSPAPRRSRTAPPKRRG